jgi:hypothetical protein
MREILSLREGNMSLQLANSTVILPLRKKKYGVQGCIMAVKTVVLLLCFGEEEYRSYRRWLIAAEGGRGTPYTHTACSRTTARSWEGTKILLSCPAW